jgi:hypothetical protein
VGGSLFTLKYLRSEYLSVMDLYVLKNACEIIRLISCADTIKDILEER